MRPFLALRVLIACATVLCFPRTPYTTDSHLLQTTALSGQAFFSGTRALGRRPIHAPSVGIVGAGAVGGTLAILLADAGFKVTLYDRRHSLLAETSTHNSNRLHAGAHYPRSFETAVEAYRASGLFQRMFPEAIMGGMRSYYAITDNDSLITSEQYRDFLERLGIPYRQSTFNAMVSPNQSHAIFHVEEDFIDLERLRHAIQTRLWNRAVTLKLGKSVTAEMMRDRHDQVIYATYAGMNALLPETDRLPFQFEVMELVKVRLPAQYRNMSVVYLDGQFATLGPADREGLHVLTHVVESVHHSNVGLLPDVPTEYLPLLFNGLHSTSEPLSRAERIVNASLPFFPVLAEAEIVGSLYTLKAVPPRRNNSEVNRNSHVLDISPKEIAIFGAKLTSAVDIAAHAVELLKARWFPSTTTESISPRSRPVQSSPILGVSERAPAADRFSALIRQQLPGRTRLSILALEARGGQHLEAVAHSLRSDGFRVHKSGTDLFGSYAQMNPDIIHTNAADPQERLDLDETDQLKAFSQDLVMIELIESQSEALVQAGIEFLSRDGMLVITFSQSDLLTDRIHLPDTLANLARSRGLQAAMIPVPEDYPEAPIGFTSTKQYKIPRAREMLVISRHLLFTEPQRQESPLRQRNERRILAAS